MKSTPYPTKDISCKIMSKGDNLLIAENKLKKF